MDTDIVLIGLLCVLISVTPLPADTTVVGFVQVCLFVFGVVTSVVGLLDRFIPYAPQ
jgi:hypothetical protein